MGALTLTKADQCVWLGRYSERVFTELGEFFQAYDANIGLETKNYSEFCEAFDIDACTTVDDIDQFLYELLYNPTNPVSVCSDMRAAFGNAIMLRPELGTETTSYIELALFNLRRSKDPKIRLVRHRTVRDDILAFWGSVEDGGAPVEMKSLIGIGKYVERIDLATRFGRPQEEITDFARRIGFFLAGVDAPDHLPLLQTFRTLSEACEGRGYDAGLLGALAAECDGGHDADTPRPGEVMT